MYYVFVKQKMKKLTFILKHWYVVYKLQEDELFIEKIVF